MTDSAQELQNLKDQIEILKAKKEVAEYEEKVTQEVKDPQVRETKRYNAAAASGEDFRQIKSSRVRCWGVVLAHFFMAPVASVVYSAKTERWAPTLAATGVFAVGVPLVVVDAGLTATLAAPVTSIVMTVNQVKEDRKRKGFVSPEQADAAYFSRSF